MSTRASTTAGRPRTVVTQRLRTRPSASRWPATAWGAMATVALFLAATLWWLSQNRGVPVYDAGTHLSFAIDAYEALRAGHVLSAFTDSLPYPPLVHVVGALGAFVGGVNVTAPTIALDLVFVPLLALGCYQVGRLAFGPRAGVLAVLFALGSPLIIEEFHEFMLDAPEAALVALAVWAILASERFSRLRVCALAGVAVGLGMLTKETFVFFVAGAALAAAIRGGWRAWRGIALFAAVALAIALPWYVYELSTVHSLAAEALGSSRAFHKPGIAPGTAPPRFSSANLAWYFWSFLNQQLYLPLLALVAIGLVWALVGLARRRPVGAYAFELVLGAFVSWVALTETYVHDPRYAIPITIYLAVFAVGWIARLPRVPQALTTTVLAAVVVVNWLGVGFGAAPAVASGPITDTYEQPGRLTLFANHGMWVGAPIREGNVLAVLQALRRHGVREVRMYSIQENEIEFSPQGIAALAQIAGLGVAGESVDPAQAGRDVAFLIHRLPQLGLPTPCTTLQNGMGVWVSLGGQGSDGEASYYCPLHDEVGDS